jgi:hypothetical protein
MVFSFVGISSASRFRGLPHPCGAGLLIPFRTKRGLGRERVNYRCDRITSLRLDRQTCAPAKCSPIPARAISALHGALRRNRRAWPSRRESHSLQCRYRQTFESRDSGAVPVGYPIETHEPKIHYAAGRVPYGHRARYEAVFRRAAPIGQSDE